MAIMGTIIWLSVFGVGGILLQIFLSSRECKWLGLILPAITFLYALLMVFSLAFYQGSLMEHIVTCLAVFVQANIPTAILLAIYFALRAKKKRRTQLEKMQIQDLS